MIRLGALILATLAALFVILSALGDGNLRADRQPAPDERMAPLGPVPEPVAPAEITPVVVEAESQTPSRCSASQAPPCALARICGRNPVATALPDGPVLYVTGDRVNMRAGPSTGDRVVSSLVRGTAVQPLGPTDAEWVNIRDADGRVGYVAGRFLSQTAP
ncbi:SH3 domain-containing protein [Paracoccus aerius]